MKNKSQSSNSHQIIKPSHEINKSAFYMSAGTLISRLLGFVRDIVIGYFFNRTETDAFFVAFRFPNFFRRFFGEGALTVSFVPTFIEFLHGSTDKNQNLIKAKNLMNSIYTLLLICISTLTVLGIYFMDILIQWMFGSYQFSLIEGKIEMTILLSRILFIYLFLVVNYAYFTAIANAFNYFFIPALAPALFNLSIICLALFLPKDLFLYPSMVLAVGVIVGGILQAIMTGFVLIRLKFFPVLRFSFSSHYHMVLKRFLPGIIGVGGFALMGMLNVFFAGWLEEGTHTYIYYADRLLELPRSLVAVSMGTALLPSLSRLYVTKNQASMMDIAASQRDLLLYIIFPCALGLLLLGFPMIDVLFARGKFDSHTVHQTAGILKIYSLLLVFLSLNQVLSTCYFVIKNTWYPAVSTFLSLIVHIILTPLLISKIGLHGLIWSTTISSFVQLMVLVMGYKYFIGNFHFMRSFVHFLKLLPVVGIFGIYIYFVFEGCFYVLENIFSIKGAKGIALFLTLFSSMVFYGYMGLRFKLDQAQQCWIVLKPRWSRFLNFFLFLKK